MLLSDFHTVAKFAHSFRIVLCLRVDAFGNYLVCLGDFRLFIDFIHPLSVLNDSLRLQMCEFTIVRVLNLKFVWFPFLNFVFVLGKPFLDFSEAVLYIGIDLCKISRSIFECLPGLYPNSLILAIPYVNFNLARICPLIEKFY